MLKINIRTAALFTVPVLIAVLSPTTSKNADSIAVETPQISTNQTPKNVMVVSVVAKKDDRAERLNAYFAAKGSPFAGKGENFVQVADKYDIDWTLLPAIANLESQLGKAVPAYSFNPYGWNNGKYSFGSWENANEIVASSLRSRYVPVGAVTAFKIGPTYAANPNWASRVSKYQREIVNFK